MSALALVIGAVLDTLERDAELAARARALFGGVAPSDERVPLARAATQLGVRPRVLRDAARRGDLALEGPRGARVVRRSELDRWLAASAPRHVKREAGAANDTNDARASERAALARAAARVAGTR